MQIYFAIPPNSALQGLLEEFFFIYQRYKIFNTLAINSLGENQHFPTVPKYRYQHQNRQLTTYVAYAEDIGITKEEDLAYQNWINDGNPTGIEFDEQFYELQRLAYGKTIMELWWL